MSSPLYESLGNNQNNQPNILQQLKQFKENFSGDPKQKVQELLNSGKVSQAQYNRAIQIANQLQKLIK